MADWLSEMARKLEPIDIIDAHQHMGRSMYSGSETTAEGLLEGLDKYNISQALVMPQPNLEHPAALHDAIAETAAANPGRIFGMVNISPRLKDFKLEVKRCIEDLGFKAIKLHPLGHNISIASKEARAVFELASEYGVPVLIHTGTGNPQSLPSLALRPARAFPDVPIILCHAGWSVYAEEAIVTAEAAPNIVLEPSWCGPYQIRAMINAIGAERVHFGSDHVNNIPAELAKFASIGLSGKELRLCLSENAKRIFKL